MGTGGHCVLALLGVLASMSVACGDDAMPAGDGGDDGSAFDGASEDVGTDGGREDGARDDAEPSDASVGPTCVDRADLPQEAAPTLSTGGCSLPEPCGGEIEGVDWQISEVCVASLELAPEVLAVCSAARIVAVTGS